MRKPRAQGLRSFPPALRLAGCPIPVLMFCAFLALVLPAVSGAQPACPPDGDVDQNGSVTAADALLVFQQALGLAQLSGCQLTIADVFPQPDSPDGAVTASDALCIFQKALGLPSCLDALPPANLPPVADAGPDLSVDAGVMVFLSGTASDPDGAITSHAWTQTGGTPVSLTGADAATAVFVAPDVNLDATLTFRLTVTDDAGAEASDDIRVTVRSAPAPPDRASAEEVFRQHISGPVVQAKCVNCHVATGASGHTRLVFAPASDTPDHAAQNLAVFEDFLAAVADEGGGSYVLNKIQGVGHGGGVQVPPGSTEFAGMQRFLSLLGEQIAPPTPVTVATLFDTVIMASPRRTLRRAALIFAGRIPTSEEYAAVEAGDESVLRATIRGLMEGPQFHEFLIRASNDRLLTDRENGGNIVTHLFVDFSMKNYRLRKAWITTGDRRAERDYYNWLGGVHYGTYRAPLELIAFVAENDLPYTEILTADYIMANPWAAEAYGATTRFDDPADPFEFKPSRIVSYYRQGEEFKYESDPVVGAPRIIDPGPLVTHYPHAGVLNTTAFLQRYPSTATNRNRARARWTYYHFLGLDVEKSASRTTDPAALADTNNPTMHNPACTVCHVVLDPLAGAFQNYGDTGFYKDQWGGLDSLDLFYKNAEGQGADFEFGSSTEGQTVSIGAWLQAGTETVRIEPFMDPPGPEGSGFWWNPGIDHITLRNEQGEIVTRMEPELLDADLCGEAGEFEFVSYFCPNTFPVDVPESGYHDVEIAVAVVAAHHTSNERKKLSVRIGVYAEGDTWYRDMRRPGFAGDQAQHPDNSLQWLARQIVADDRFAEAAVKFWWPAITGSEVAEPPEEELDVDFEGRLLAANAQNGEVARLAGGFRNGFPGSPYVYNLRDLLAEIVLSQWFRADAVTDADPIRRAALHHAGARRLLTPEELARKTAAVTGVQWGREISTGPWDGRWFNALTQDFRMLYGGIDSAGITERARDITSVMAGVARLHALEVSCPIVMRELYLLPEADRRLFTGIDLATTPVREWSDSFEVEAGSWPAREVLSLSGALAPGPKTVRVAFANDYYQAPDDDRNIYLHRLDVRDASGLAIAGHQLGNRSITMLEIPIDIPAAGIYSLELVAWADQAGGERPRLLIAVESDTQSSRGADIIRSQLVELHDKLFGVRTTGDSPHDALYRLFVDVWQRNRDLNRNGFPFRDCGFELDHFFFDGIIDDAVIRHVNENGDWRYELDRDRVDDFLNGVDFSDPHHTAQAWVAVLAALLMDYRYLYL